MKIPNSLRKYLFRRMEKIFYSRPADFVIQNNPKEKDGYLYRWILFKNKYIGCIFLHYVNGDDEDRALHDHPWVNMSIILKGNYLEYYPNDCAFRREGSVIFRRPKTLHRLALANQNKPVWSLFITGPKVRTWGFQCPQGWIPWYDFVDPNNKGGHGPGCGE